MLEATPDASASNRPSSGMPGAPSQGTPQANFGRVPDVVELLASERVELMALAEELTVSPTQAPDLFCRAAHRAARHLPDRLVEVLTDFAYRGSHTGTLLLDRLPVLDPPPTPPDNRSHLAETTQLARAQAIVNHACGQMVAYEAEGHGRLYQDMVPNRAMALSQTSLGSGVELGAAHRAGLLQAAPRRALTGLPAWPPCG